MHWECRVVMKPTLAFLTGGTIGFQNVNLWCFHHPHSKDRRRLDIDPTLSIGSISKRHRSDGLCYLGSDGDKVGIMTTLGFHCVLGCLICPVFVYSSPPSAAYMRQWIKSALVQITACRLFGAKPLSKPMLDYFQLDPCTNFSEILIKIQNFHSRKCIW